MRATRSNALKGLLFVILAATPASADVVRIEVQSRSDLLGGQTFGAAGPYEKLAGKIFFAVDPALPANRIVTDLGRAPRNAAGKVEFRNDAGGNVHTVVGKVSFDKAKLVDNINAMIAHVRKMKPQTSKGTYLKKVVLKSSMSPAVPLAVARPQ